MYATLAEAKKVWMPSNAMMLHETHPPGTEEIFCLTKQVSTALCIHADDLILFSFTNFGGETWSVSVDYRRDLKYLLKTSQQEDMSRRRAK
jgi:hypothetical protein